ncbi:MULTISPECIES: sulfur carrier protein ThiS [Porphyromonas]|uniref:ThiS protein n=4 Tax=Porphyromonas TaxID=836 RepID=Q7MT70_PORGI|nr:MULTISPECIES: sulfur carrier protein ThiS [Porphyromonas]AAQ67070.1 thiS protein [Porphyromonas gingivalis W83]AKV65151.1 thiamine biosynthesis protein ThiS [Porphyromonas gingivalis]ATS02413.1 thiamine biosynthesis protein ThiS [Porphyromonas gingivalis]AUR47170.1 sulfur carrier protein [Porphyromonas gingivalis]AUR48929.1 sulfur carrier protein [Porphyromonas gingivalis]
MQVTINNQPITCLEGMGLAALLEAERIQVERTAIAVNGEVVPRASWPDFRLSEGDEILIIQATYGG